MALRLPPRVAKKEESERKNSRGISWSRPRRRRRGRRFRSPRPRASPPIVSIVSNNSCASRSSSDENDPRCVRPALISQHSSSSSCCGCTTTTFASARASSPVVPCVDSPRAAMGTLRDVAKTLGFSLPPPPSTVPGFHEYANLTLSVDCVAPLDSAARSPSGASHPPRTETRPPSPSSGTRHRRRSQGTRSTRRSLFVGCQPSG